MRSARPLFVTPACTCLLAIFLVMRHAGVHFLLSLVACAAAVQPTINGTSAFYDKVEGGGSWFVFFFAPWCGHCQALEPEWQTLSQRLHGSGTSAISIDATAVTDLAALYEVEGYPTLLLLSAGRVFEFRGDRTADDMLAFAEGGFEGDRPHSRPMPPRPSWLDPLLALPSNVTRLLQFAVEQHPLAAVLLAAGIFSLGVLVTLACLGPQFILVHAPADEVRPGQQFQVELPGGWLRRRQMRVAAPAGIKAGQPFFVPLVSPPVAKHVPEESEDESDDDVTDESEKKSQ